MAQLTKYLTRDDEPNDEEFEDETPGEIAETVSIQADHGQKTRTSVLPVLEIQF